MLHTRWLRLFGPLASTGLAVLLAGCLQVPEYRRPAGYSSTYHRHLRESQAVFYGESAPASAIVVESHGSEGRKPATAD
ncbi:MAG: hypothetical protein WD069_15055 [Planctomycetales bacterium]